MGGGTQRGAADMEGTHGELGARLADGLRGDHADRFADVDQMAAAEVTAISTSSTRRSWIGR